MKTSALAVAIGLGAALALPASAQMKPEDAVLNRKATMRVMGLNFYSLGRMVRGEQPFDKELFARNIARAEAVSTMPILTYFPAASDGVGQTRAKPEIWKNWDKFKGNLERMQSELAKLAQVSRGGDEAAMKGQFNEVGKACKGCHDDFQRE